MNTNSHLDRTQPERFEHPILTGLFYCGVLHNQAHPLWVADWVLWLDIQMFLLLRGDLTDRARAQSVRTADECHHRPVVGLLINPLQNVQQLLTVPHSPQPTLR